MGGAAISSFFTAAEARDDVFKQTLSKEKYLEFIQQEHAVSAFAQFVKNGHWLSVLSHFDHCDHTKPSTPKNNTRKSAELRWIYLHYAVVDPLKEQVDEFLQLAGVNDAQSSPSSRKVLNRSMTASGFHESYKFNPESASFSLDEMAAIMCTILFPLFLGSEEYQHWKAWHVAKSKRIAGPFLVSESGEHTGDFGNDGAEESTGTEDVEHMKQLLLGTAAFLDEAELKTHFARPSLFEDAAAAIQATVLGLCICQARPPAHGGHVGHGSQVLVCKEATPVVFINRAFEKITGFSAKSIIGKELSVLNGAQTEKQQIDRLNQALKERSDVKVVLTQYKRNGSKFVAAVALKPSYDNMGVLVFWIAVIYDLSHKNASLTELKRVHDLLALVPNLLNYPPGDTDS